MNYDTIKDFQTSIAAIVGFIGVITTLVVNARLARVQNAEKDRKAQATLESALKQELISIRDELKSIRRAATDKGLEAGSSSPWRRLTSITRWSKTLGCYLQRRPGSSSAYTASCISQ